MVGTVEQCFKVDVISGVTGDTHVSIAGWAGTRPGTRTMWNLITIVSDRTEMNTYFYQRSR